VRLLTLLPCLVLTSIPLGSASAADATSMPPRFRADLAVGYRGSFEQVGLEEQGETYAIRDTLSHVVDIDLIGTVWSGLGITVGLPVLARQGISWPGAREMRIDPLTGEGSYQGGRALEVDPLTNGGLQGAWFGVAASPFREGWANSLPITWRLDLAIRTPGKNQTLYGDNRGGAPGGAALRLATAFSRQVGSTDTWMSFRYTREFAAKDVEVTLPDGTATGAIDVREGDTIDARVGATFLLKDDPLKGIRTGIGLWAGIGWTGEARRPSGFWLPQVLDSTAGTVVVASDRLAARLGLDVRIDPAKQAGFRIGLQGAYLTPRVEEHVYPVATDVGSWSIGWNVTVLGRVRLKDDPLVDGAPGR